jgi:protein-disulfide isomerase
MSALKYPVHEGDHVLGNADAPCTLVEYGDYQCPHCRAAHPVVKKLERHFGDRLRFVFRNFPLTQIHPDAEPAAEAAEFAAAGGKFWEMHDELYHYQERLGEELYEELAVKLGLDTEGLRTALENEAYLGKVRSDFSGGVRSGVNGTPTFFINGDRHNGPHDFESLSAKIEAAL